LRSFDNLSNFSASAAEVKTFPRICNFEKKLYFSFNSKSLSFGGLERRGEEERREERRKGREQEKEMEKRREKREEGSVTTTMEVETDPVEQYLCKEGVKDRDKGKEHFLLNNLCVKTAVLIRLADPQQPRNNGDVRAVVFSRDTWL
jgi:hypothetical protein